MINLVKNALKDTHYGAIKIKAAYDYTNELLKVQVLNSGKGRNREERDQLREQLSLQPNSSQQLKGLCMGLAVCRDLVHKCQGSINFHSKGLNQAQSYMFTMKMKMEQDENDAVQRDSIVCPEDLGSNLIAPS